MRGRATKVELAERLSFVRQMLAAGMERRQVTALGAKLWGVGRVQMWRYMMWVYADWQKLMEAASPQLQALAVAQRNDIFRRALKEGKLRVALQALESRDVMWGLCDRRGRPTVGHEARLMDLIRESLGEGEKLVLEAGEEEELRLDESEAEVLQVESGGG